MSKLVFLLLTFFFKFLWAETFLYEEFLTLNNWRPLKFRNITALSRYEILDGGILKASSLGSASAIIYRKSFDAYSYPLLEVRWMVENIYEKGDATSKSGEDFPIRIYIIFEYSPEKSTVLKKLKYNFIKKFYGEYPPHSALNYVWASKLNKGSIVTSPYSDSSKTFALQSGSNKVGEWVTENRNIIEDYLSAFGEYPPNNASIAIMSDSDNTMEQATAYIDYIKISDD